VTVIANPSDIVHYVREQPATFADRLRIKRRVRESKRAGGEEAPSV